MKEPLLPGTTALFATTFATSRRGSGTSATETRLAVMLGPLCFEQTDEECAKFIEAAFDLALESDVAVGFHIDDSMFWLRRKDLWSDPNNVEAMDWDGTPCTGRRLDWAKSPRKPRRRCASTVR